MTYAELLLSEDWRKKREFIISRDSNKCISCDNKSFISSFQESPVGLIVGKNHKISSELSVGSLRAFIPIGIDKFIEHKEELSSKTIKGLFVEVPWKAIHLADIHGLYCDKRVGNEIKRVWIYAKGLHVHHKYYQIGLFPWEYPDDALLTLCWDCHGRLHENEIVPVFDSNGIKISDYHVCERCCGAGWFPEFRHIQSGVCFKCKGAKYEELIDS